MNKQGIQQIRTIAVYQIIGGVLGIAFTAWDMYTEDAILTPLILRLGIVAFGLFVFSIVCGRMLLLNPGLGLTISIINQVLQVIYFSFGAYAFEYVAGLRIGAGIDMAMGWAIKFSVALSSFDLNLENEQGQEILGINLVAVFLVFWMTRLLAKVKQQQARI